LLGQLVIGVVLICGMNTTLNAVGTVADRVVLEAGAVMTMNAVGDLFAGQSIEAVVAVVCGAAIQFGNPGSATRRIEGVGKLLAQCVMSVVTAHVCQSMQGIECPALSSAIGIVDPDLVPTAS